MKRVLNATTLMLTLLLMAISSASNGTTLLAQDLESLTANADRICTGRVLDATSFMKGRRIYTLSRVEIIDSIKGENRTGEILEVVTAGGHSEFFSQKVFGAAELEVDEEYLLFLEHRGAPTIAHTVGMTQGALPISVDSAKTDRMVYPPKAMPRLMRRDAANGGLRTAAPWLSNPRRLSDVLDQVRSYLEGAQ
jgi:hypothetical protein